MVYTSTLEKYVFLRISGRKKIVLFAYVFLWLFAPMSGETENALVQPQTGSKPAVTVTPLAIETFVHVCVCVHWSVCVGRYKRYRTMV